MTKQHNDTHTSHALRPDSRSIPILQQSRKARQHSVTHTQVLTVRPGAVLEQTDWLAAEEPLEIRVHGPGQEIVSVSITMRTPGHDHELAVGFLYTEGLLHSCAEVLTVTPDSSEQNEQPCNVVTVQLANSFNAASLQRNFYATSSLGSRGAGSSPPPLPDLQCR